jgi:hypothetical protein
MAVSPTVRLVVAVLVRKNVRHSRVFVTSRVTEHAGSSARARMAMTEDDQHLDIKPFRYVPSPVGLAAAHASPRTMTTPRARRTTNCRAYRPNSPTHQHIRTRTRTFRRVTHKSRITSASSTSTWSAASAGHPARRRPGVASPLGATAARCSPGLPRAPDGPRGHRTRVCDHDGRHQQGLEVVTHCPLTTRTLT